MNLPYASLPRYCSDCNEWLLWGNNIDTIMDDETSTDDDDNAEPMLTDIDEDDNENEEED